ncbi:hypothetical protein [Vandammella animalimorsus]|uniref:hypothetical protein n=1 Tax=Vandammella animalimorsus TaxID=2029117 RepID=UPI001177EAF9|nr:hypothetical protein [Vandammella animalimorsus]
MRALFLLLFLAFSGNSFAAYVFDKCTSISLSTCYWGYAHVGWVAVGASEDFSSDYDSLLDSEYQKNIDQLKIKYPTATNFRLVSKTYRTAPGYGFQEADYEVIYDLNGFDKHIIFRPSVKAAYDPEKLSGGPPKTDDPGPPPRPPGCVLESRALGTFQGRYVGPYSDFCIGGCSYSLVGVVEYGDSFSLTVTDPTKHCSSETKDFVAPKEGEGEDENGGGNSGDNDDENQPPKPCPPGTRPGEVNGERVCQPDGQDDNNQPSGPAQEIIVSGPYACVRDYKNEFDFEMECVFCGAPGLPPCSVAIKDFDKLKQPLDKIVNSGTESNKYLKEISETLKKLEAKPNPGGGGGGSSGGGNQGEGQGQGEGGGEGEGDCKEGDNSAKCAKLGEAGEGEGDGEGQKLDITYQRESIFGGGTCPANVVSTVNGRSVTIYNWVYACGLIRGYVRPVILVLAALTALFIIIPRK